MPLMQGLMREFLELRNRRVTVDQDSYSMEDLTPSPLPVRLLTHLKRRGGNI